MEMKLSNLGLLFMDPTNRRSCFCNLFPAAAFLCIVFFIISSIVTFDYKEKISLEPAHSIQISQSSPSNSCKSRCIPSGTAPLPKGIVSRTSNLEMRPLWGSRRSRNIEGKANLSKSLLAIPVGIKQKEVVNQIVMKFPSSNFTVMLFHYDGVMDEWRDLQWSDTALHISAINQTKWWFAKRFLHPDIVAEYDYIFLWDEDLDVEHFHPGRYLSIVKREGLEISQPGLDTGKSQVHHRITGRWRKGDVHRRIYKFSGGGRCYENSTAPPCTGRLQHETPFLVIFLILSYTINRFLGISIDVPSFFFITMGKISKEIRFLFRFGSAYHLSRFSQFCHVSLFGLNCFLLSCSNIVSHQN